MAALPKKYRSKRTLQHRALQTLLWNSVIFRSIVLCLLIKGCFIFPLWVCIKKANTVSHDVTEIHTNCKKSSPRILSLWYHCVTRNVTHKLVTKFIARLCYSDTIGSSHKSCQKCWKGSSLKQYLKFSYKLLSVIFGMTDNLLHPVLIYSLGFCLVACKSTQYDTATLTSAVTQEVREEAIHLFPELFVRCKQSSTYDTTPKSSPRVPQKLESSKNAQGCQIN